MGLYNAELEKTKLLRSYYRELTGHQSDPAWYKFRKALESNGLYTGNMEQIKANIRKLVTIKQGLPKTGVPLSEVVKFYVISEKTIKELNGRSLKGEELVALIKEQGIKLASSTCSSWFSKVGGYSRKRSYCTDEIMHILLKASVYTSKRKRAE